MELRRLRYFVAVAEEGSVSAAALRLKMAQPPLSQQILRMERELGCPLFSRNSKGLSLTRAGEALLMRARHLLRGAESAVADVHAAHAGKAGRVALGFMQSAVYTVLPAMLRLYHRSYPDVELDLHEMGISDQYAALANGSIDVGVVRPPVTGPGLHALCVLREPSVVAMAQSHPLATRSRLTLASLANIPMIAHPRSNPAGFRARIDEAFGAAGIAPRVFHESTQVQTLCGLAASGLGVAIVPRGGSRAGHRGLALRSAGGPWIACRNLDRMARGSRTHAGTTFRRSGASVSP